MRSPLLLPPPRLNFRDAFVAELLEIERQLCDDIRKWHQLESVQAQIFNEIEQSGRPRPDLEDRSKKVHEQIAPLVASIARREKEAKQRRLALLRLSPPITLPDPCGLWTDDEDLNPPAASMSLGQIEAVSSSTEWQNPLRERCEEFAVDHPTKEAVTAEADQARKNATELYKAARREKDAVTAAKFHDAAIRADFYANCLTRKLAELPPLTLPVPPKPTLSPAGKLTVDYGSMKRLYPNGFPVPSNPSKPFGPVFNPFVVPPIEAGILEEGGVIPGKDNPPPGLQDCQDRIETWKQWYYDQTKEHSMGTRAILYGSKQNGLRLGAVDGALVVSVVDTDGNPVDNAMVRLKQSGGVLFEQPTSGGVAEFALTNFQLGPSTVEIVPPSGYAAKTQMTTSINLNATVNTLEFVVEKTSWTGLVLALFGIGGGAAIAAAFTS